MKHLYALLTLACVTAALRPLNDVLPLNQLHDAPRFVSKDSENHAEEELKKEAADDVKLAKTIAENVKPKHAPKESSAAGEKTAEAKMKLTEQELMETEGEASSIAAEDTKDKEVASVQKALAKQLVNNAQKDKNAAEATVENASREH